MTKGLPATLRLVYHRDEPTPRDVPLEQVYADLTYPAERGMLPYVVMNMVQTLDGAAALEGRAWTIGTAVDHYLYRTLHGMVDAVVSGAGTLRLEDVVAGTHPHLRARRETAGLPPAPTAVVLSRTAEFGEAVYRKAFFTRQDFASLVLTTQRARRSDIDRLTGAGVEVAVVHEDQAGSVDLPAALRYLAARGFRRVLAEGGPRLATALLHQGVVRELFLTVTFRLAGERDAPRIVGGGPPAGVTPISVYHYLDVDGALREMYLRLALPQAAGTLEESLA